MALIFDRPGALWRLSLAWLARNAPDATECWANFQHNLQRLVAEQEAKALEVPKKKRKRNR